MKHNKKIMAVYFEHGVKIELIKPRVPRKLRTPRIAKKTKKGGFASIDLNKA
jgi:hypothetical protein